MSDIAERLPKLAARMSKYGSSLNVVHTDIGQDFRDSANGHSEAADEIARLKSEAFVLAAQNARLRKLKKARDPDETDEAINDLLDNQAWIILSHVAARIGPPDLMEAWQDAWAAGQVQEGYFTPTRGVAAWIAARVTLSDSGSDPEGEKP